MKKVTCANLLTFSLAAFIPYSPSTYWNGVFTFRVSLSTQILSYMLFPDNTPETHPTVARLSIKLCLFTFGVSIAQILPNRYLGLNQDLLARERLDVPHNQVTMYLHAEVNST